MSTYPFALVDVFCDGPFTGNPLAVVTLQHEIDTTLMQRITRWLNLSETTFLLPPTDPRADYRVRIFCLERELPFAGHPTLGTCHVWLEGGGIPQGEAVMQQCGAGLIAIKRGVSGLAFAAPPLLRDGPVEHGLVVEAAEVLRISPDEIVAAQWVDNGPGWMAVMLKSAEAVLALEPARSHSRRIDLGVVGFHPPGGAELYEVRAFFRDSFGGLIEDPVTGSLNASVAQWLVGTGQAIPPFVAAQGTQLLRRGRVQVTADAAGQLWIGGASFTNMLGTAVLPD